MLMRLRRNNVSFQPYVEHVSLAGVSFDFWVGDATSKSWYSPDEHIHFAEHTETARLIKRSDRVLEIGAHHGFTAMLLSKLVGPDGFILAVEPSPFNAMMAAAQIGLNCATNCQVLQIAVSSRSENLHISHESNARVTDSHNALEVHAVTVDELDFSWGPFNVLKIDVEGFEHQVLIGAARMLSRRPKILLELHSTLISSTVIRSILELLPSYEGVFVMRNHRTETHTYPEEMPETDDIANLFLKPRTI